MKLQEGRKYYQKCDGKKIEVRRRKDLRDGGCWSLDKYPWIGSDGISRTDDGRQLSVSEGRNEFDLVSEVLQLRVGGRYKNGKNEIITIDLTDGEQPWPWHCKENGYWYTDDGRYETEPNLLDLVEEIATCEDCPYAPGHYGDCCPTIPQIQSGSVTSFTRPAEVGCDRCDDKTMQIIVPPGQAYTVNGVNVAELQAENKRLHECVRSAYHAACLIEQKLRVV